MQRYLAGGLWLLWAAASNVQAWGGDGHQIVAAVAQHHLTPEARDGVQQLLGTAHIYDRDVAAWADDIRSSQPATRRWHFVDIPLAADAYSLSRDCEGDDCALAKIEEFSRQIADPTASRADRATALKFLVHFMGDLHQPLHCVDNHDRGGNEVPVHYQGHVRPANLHSTWDSLILDDLIGKRDTIEYAESLDVGITREQIQGWTSSSPTSWTDEAHKAAQVIYRELPTAGTDGARSLPKNYGPGHKETVELQLRKGGIRLASLLNKAFSSAPGDNKVEAVPLYPAGQREKLSSRRNRD